MEEVSESREIIRQIKNDMKLLMQGKKDRHALRKEGSMQILQLKCLNEKCQLKVKDEWEKTENAKNQLNNKRQSHQAVQYRINRLREQIEDDLAVRAEGVDLVTFDEFNSNAPEYLKRKSQQNSHDQHLARLEYELMQRKEMNSSLKTKQEELLKLKSEIIEKESNLTITEPGLKNLLESTQPLLAGLELQLGELGNTLTFDSFDEYDLNDSLMCLFRQCKNLGDDVLVKYHSRDSFQVQYQSYIFDFTSDKTGCVFIKSNKSLDSVGLNDFGTSRPNMFGQSDASNDPEFTDRIKAGYRCYRWLQNICGLELILKEDELIRVPNFENFIKILA